MGQIIIDEDAGTAKKITYVSEKTVPLDEYLAELSGGTPVIIPFVPNNCRGIVTFSTYTGMIIEMFPITLPIRFHETVYRIHFPYMYWSIIIQNRPISMMGVGMVYANERVVNEKSKLGFLATPNLQKAGGKFPIGVVCFQDVNVTRTSSLDICANDLIHAVLTSNFNNDYFYWDDIEHYPCKLLMNAKNKYVTETSLKALERKDKKWWDEYSELSKIETRNNEQSLRLQILDKAQPIEFKKAQLARSSGHHAYMLGWEMLSQKMPLNKFTKKIDLPNQSTYKEMIDFIYHSIERYNGNR